MEKHAGAKTTTKTNNACDEGQRQWETEAPNVNVRKRTPRWFVDTYPIIYNLTQVTCNADGSHKLLEVSWLTIAVTTLSQMCLPLLFENYLEQSA
jgi:hypothetical protein